MKLRFIASGVTIVALLAVLVAGENAAEETQEPQQQTPVHENPADQLLVAKPGEREYLSPNLIGVQNIAMTFLPLTMNFINIIDANREIVNGVRYEIMLNAVDTKDHNAELICRLVVFEKPWLRNEWGDKVRELRYTNCTSDAENMADLAGRSKALNDKYKSNTIFNGATRNELSDDEMAKLESQIMPFPTTTTNYQRPSSTVDDEMARIEAQIIPFPATMNQRESTAEQVVHSSGAALPIPDSSTTTSTVLPDYVESPTQQPAEINQLLTPSTTATAADETVGEDEDAATQPPSLADNAQRVVDELLTVSALNFENTRRGQQQQQPNEAPADTADNTDVHGNFLRHVSPWQHDLDANSQQQQQQQ